jgi:DNA-binding transcriptional MerR regulator
MSINRRQTKQMFKEMRIGELAQASGMLPKTIRFYEEIGLLPPAQRTENRYRIYNQEDVQRLRFIRNARRLDFSIDDLKEVLALRDRGEAPCRYVSHLLETKQLEIEVRIRQLQELQQELQQLLDQASSLPDDDIEMKNCVCHLIYNRQKSGEENPSSSAAQDLLPDFAPSQPLQAMHQAILRHFIEAGQAPTVAALTIILARSPVEIEPMLAELATKCLYRDPATGEILAAYPFSARPTRHRLHLLNGQEVYAMCAIDALGVSAMLDQPVIIYSSCAHCGRPVSLEVQGERLGAVYPSSVVIWYQAAEASCVPATAKCPGINFFCQEAHRVAWNKTHPDSKGHQLTVATALERGIKIFGHLLR